MNKRLPLLRVDRLFRGLAMVAIALLSLCRFKAEAQVTDFLLKTNLHEPFGVTVGDENTYFITDSANNQVLAYNPATGILATLAGASEFGAVDETREFARFYNPQGVVAVTNAGGKFLIVADSGNHLIRRIDYDPKSPTYGVVKNLAGPIKAAADSHKFGLRPDSFGLADGIGIAARFNAPSGLAWNGTNSIIYIADTLNGVVRSLDLSNNEVKTVSTGYTRPVGVAVGVISVAAQPLPVVFVADAATHSISYFITDPNNQKFGVRTLFSGSGSPFASGNLDSAVALNARFTSPRGLLWDSTRSELLIADSGNGLIRRASNLSLTGGLVTGAIDTVGTGGGIQLQSPIGLARDQQRFLLIADLTANSLMVIRSSGVQTRVKEPSIGSIKLNDTFACYLLTPLTNATFNNEFTLGVEREEGTIPYFTVGPTELVENQPDPTVADATPPEFKVCQLDRPSSLLTSIANRRSPRMTIKLAAFADGRLPSKVVTASFVFQVASPVVTGTDSTQVRFTTETEGAVIYYTATSDTNQVLLPSPPIGDAKAVGTPYDPAKPPDLYNGTNVVVVRARAFKSGYLDSTVTTQVFEPALARPTTIGVSRSVTNAPGSTSLLPVVVTISPQAFLATVQFKAEVAPKKVANPAVTPTIRALPVNGQSDFFILNGPNIPSPTVLNYSKSNNGTNINGVAIAYLRGGEVMVDEVTVAMLAVTIPPNAKHGDRYSLSVLSPSGTSDGGPTAASIRPAFIVPEVVVSTNVSYVVGDVARADWFNAGENLDGEFGDGLLANNDVVQTLRASLRLAVPYLESDLFDAMDVFPLDTPPTRGGDRAIRFLDYMWTLRRSLGLESNNFVRFWKNGVRVSRTVLPGELIESAVPEQPSSDLAWNRKALLYCVPQDSVNPGDEVGLDIMMKVRSGASVSGLQFAAKVLAVDGNAPSPLNVRYAPADNPRQPETTGVIGANGFYCVWNVDDSKPSWKGLVKLGQVRLKVPAGASFGQQYYVSLSAVDGAPDLYTTYEFETARGGLGIETAATVRPNGLSDEWVERFFPNGGSAAAPGADSDGDGLTNLLEYESGTDPTANDLVVRTTLSLRGGPRLSWFGGVGLRYVVEASANLQQPDWKPVSSTLGGQGADLTYEPNPAAAASGFYRVRLVKPTP